MQRSVLLVDDDEAILRVLSRHFDRAGWTAYQAVSGEDGVRTYDGRLPDLVLLDVGLPGLGGLDVLDVLIGRGAVVAMLTGNADVATAVEAMERGAATFLTKPCDLDRLLATAERLADSAVLRRTARTHAALADAPPLGTSPRMRELQRQVVLVAASPGTSVLLLGESGTGKGFVARMIHTQSARARAPFVEVNCAGLSATFLDSELFGHERGAFTDAREMKKGLFEIAAGGTIFLDEVGDLDPALQPKLLKVLERHSFRRLGGTRELSTDVRVIAATNRDLASDVRAGRFREDLFYRLAVFPLTVPPLRERSAEDVLSLVTPFLRELRKSPATPAELSPRALSALVSHTWPGNVRELRNALEHASVLAHGESAICPEHLPAAVRCCRKPERPAPGLDVMPLVEVERQHIERTLRATRGNRTAAATKLGISRGTLHVKIREYRLEDVGRAA